MRNGFSLNILMLIIGLTCMNCGFFINPFSDNSDGVLSPTIEPTPMPTSIELALNRPASADTYFRYNSPGSAVDGDVSTGWCAVSSPLPISWSVKLNAVYHLTSIQIIFTDTNLQAKYKIETSPDNTNWTQVLDKTNNNKQEQIQMENLSKIIPGQYVKMTFTGYLTDSWPMIHEFKVYGFGDTPSPTPTTTPVVTPGNNLVINPGFELDGGDMQNPTGWHSTGDLLADYVENGNTKTLVYAPHSGTYKLRQLGGDKNIANFSIYTYQLITGLPDGLYTFRAWACSGTSTHYLKASKYGATDLTSTITAVVVGNNPVAVSDYQQFSITDIPVTSGQCEIGFQTTGDTKETMTHIDDVEFFLQP